MLSIEAIKNEILSHTNAEQRRIKGIWSVDCLYNPAGNGRIFNYKFLLTQTKGLGCSYSVNTDYPVSMLEALVGKDALALGVDDTALLVSILDACYPCCADKKPVRVETIDGDSEKKMRWRSEIILTEAEKLLGTVKGRRIVNVGVVGDILRTFAAKGADIVGTDFDETIIGKKMFDTVDIIDGSHTLDIIAESELCVVTGMTISTHTIDPIINCCRKNNVKIIVFAETGANLGGYFVKNGVDTYLGEIFPFYIFNGSSRIDVYTA
jgi:hypothetical protein